MNDRHLEPPEPYDEAAEHELATRYENDADNWRKGEL